MSNGTLDAIGMMMFRAPYFCDELNDKTIERRQQVPLPTSHPHQAYGEQYGINISFDMLLLIKAKLPNYGTKLHVLDKPKLGSLSKKHIDN